MPKIIVVTDFDEPVHEIVVAADDLATPIARANFFIDLNVALKRAAIDTERVMRYTGWACEMAIAAITQWKRHDPSWTSDYLGKYEVAE